MICKWHLCNKLVKDKSLYCSDKCKNKFNVTKYTKKRKQKLVLYKGSKCENCGYSKCLAALTFHHLDPSVKDFGISETISRSKNLDQLKKEVDKCKLLCSNCHAEEHYLETENLYLNENQTASV